MKWIFLTVVFLHGIIHLLGFVKGFDLKEMKEFTVPTSKLMGVMWLCAFVLFAIYIFLFVTNHKYAWLFGFFAAALSQILIVVFWKDAKFGTIPNVLLLLVSIIGFGSFLLQTEFSNRVTTDFEINNTLSTDILTEADIAHLPEIVQKYLHYTKSVGQPKIKNFRAEFVGGMRGKPEDDYKKLHSVQYNFYQRPSRYFYMEASKMGLPATGLHLYEKENATFEVKMLNWLSVVSAKGDKMNQAETVTILNDMCFIAPATLIDCRISWKQIEDTIVNAVFKNGNISIEAMLYFDTNGALRNFISNDRYETDGKSYNNFPWATPVEDYKMINGYFLPSKAKLIYQKPEGDFTYGELEYKSVEYNLMEIQD